MLLRDHPLMLYRGVPNWPPVWSCTDGRNQHPRGEVGTLKPVFRSDMQPRLIDAFCLFLMKDQSISPVCYSMTLHSAGK
jgi:hypothetical protein